MAITAVYRTLWRRKLFILFMTAVVVGTTYGLTSRQEKEYTASSLVRIEQKVTQASDVYGALITGERLARTYALIAGTDSVWDLVRERLPASVPDDAIRINATQVSNLEVLRLAVTYSDPIVAARVANAVPGALADFARGSGAAREEITTVEHAQPPSSPTSPNMSRNIFLATLLGLILNSGLVLLIEAFSDRVEGAEDLERATGYPVIASIPPLHLVGLSALAPLAEPLSQPPRHVWARPARTTPLPDVRGDQSATLVRRWSEPAGPGGET